MKWIIIFLMGIAMIETVNALCWNPLELFCIFEAEAQEQQQSSGNIIKQKTILTSPYTSNDKEFMSNMKVYKSLDNLKFSYKNFRNLTITPKIIHNNGNNYTLSQVKALFPQIEFNITLKQDEFVFKFAPTITNIPVSQKGKWNLSFEVTELTNIDFNRIIINGQGIEFYDIYRIDFSDLLEDYNVKTISKTNFIIYDLSGSGLNCLNCTFDPTVTAVLNTSNLTGGGDAYGKSGSTFSTYNTGADTIIRAGNRTNGANIYQGLIKFNTSVIPSDAIIENCTLRLYLAAADDTKSYNIEVYRILQDWGEGNKDEVTATDNESSWDAFKFNCPSCPNSGNWYVPMVNKTNDSGIENGNDDRYATPEANISVGGSGALGFYNWNVTNACKNWVNGSWGWSYGLALVNNNTNIAGSRKGFTSFQGVDANNRPQLIVEYTEAISDTTPPSGNLTTITNNSIYNATKILIGSLWNESGTGRWVVNLTSNSTFTITAGTNHTYFLNASNGTYRVEANNTDTSGNIGTTPFFIFEIANVTAIEVPTDDCSCPASGDWIINDGSNCILTTECDLGGNKFYCDSGTLTINGAGKLTANGGAIKAGCLKARAGGFVI